MIHRGKVTLATALVTTYTYDALGNLATETLPTSGGGIITAYTYNSLNELTSMVEFIDQSGGTSGVYDVGVDTRIAEYDYTLNLAGDRTGVTETDDSGNVTTTAWTYDADGRLTGESYDAPGSSDDYTTAFTFDLANNRVAESKWDTAGADLTSTPGETIVYIYNGDDQLTAETSSISGETDYEYDLNGSQANDGTHKYVYDARNKMVEITDESNVVLASYVYDDAGNRVQETTGGTTTFYLTDVNNPTGYAQPLETWTGTTGVLADATLMMTYILGNSVIAQADASGGVTYLLKDGHGSTRMLANSTGAVTAHFAYDAFGTALNFTPATAGTIFLYGGDAVYDPASGLYLHGDGVRGRDGFRFIEADAQNNGSNQDPISLHKYLYANENPANIFDPSGNEGTTELITVISLSVLLVGLEVGGYARGPTPMTLAPQLPADISTASVLYQWAELQGSTWTADQVFKRLSSLKDLPSSDITRNAAPTGVGSIVLFKLSSLLLSSGQRDFRVRIVKFDPGKRLMVAETLEGHPLEGWRAWQVTPESDGNILVETWSIDQPHGLTNEAKFNIGGETNQKATWAGLLQNLAFGIGANIVRGDIYGYRGGVGDLGDFYTRLDLDQ